MRKVYVVGLGPGGEQYLTEEARAALDAAEVLCGYTVYVDLVAPLYPGKETFTTPMTKEIDRCRWALETANSGRTVAMVCSGDAGVYGMAGPILELAADYPEVEVEVVAGVTAALSGGAVLGAPLGHDFCVISLSDLLTPWELIERRLACAADGDFAVCLYNPSSKKRKDYLRRACEILLRSRSGDTVCGWVRNIGREGNILLATGMKELPAFAGISPARLYPRVLPTGDSIAACERAGIPHRNIIAMQGPFSAELNEALIRQFHIAFLVTKDGGRAGGFQEKVQAAENTGIELVLIRRPEETGEPFEEITAACEELMR